MATTHAGSCCRQPRLNWKHHAHSRHLPVVLVLVCPSPGLVRRQDGPTILAPLVVLRLGEVELHKTHEPEPSKSLGSMLLRIREIERLFLNLSVTQAVRDIRIRRQTESLQGTYRRHFQGLSKVSIHGV